MFAVARNGFALVSCAAAIAISVDAQVPVTKLPPVNITGQAYTDRDAYGDTASTWPLSARRAVLDSLAAARRRWESNRPASYRISAGILCGFCGDGSKASRPPDAYPVARIRGHEAFATGTFRSADEIHGGIWLLVPVDSLFRLLEKTANDTARKITALTFDPVYGFPQSWATDGARNGYGGRFVTDQDDWGRVVLFAPDSPPAHCGPWRRLFHSCPPPFPALDNEVLARNAVDRPARPAADRPLPLFPPAMRAEGKDGVVRVSYAVDANGRMIPNSGDIIRSTDGLFMSAVFDVMDRWTFAPARAQGRRVASRYEELFEFRAAGAGGGDNVPYALRDTTTDGVPRTIIGFRPRTTSRSAQP